MISIICPVLNEEKYIKKIIEFFLAAKPIEKELLLIDGGSTDKTLDIIRLYCKENSNIKLFHNVNKTVPYALNMGIKNSIGEIIIRIDAHAEYSIDYFEKIIETFNNTDADIVGGPCRTKSENNFQEAVSIAISHPLGTGGSKNHDENYRGYTDHPTYGAWRRELFNDVGYFDERLVRNHDDEFDYRAKSLGKKIYQNPDIKLYYYPRSTPSSLFKQYYQYGLYKPMVLRKVKSEIKIRHLVPSVFALYMLIITPLSLFNYVFLVPLLLYFILMVIFALKSKTKVKVKLSSFIVFPIIHFSYGIGFILGGFKKNGG